LRRRRCRGFSDLAILASHRFLSKLSLGPHKRAIEPVSYTSLLASSTEHVTPSSADIPRIDHCSLLPSHSEKFGIFQHIRESFRGSLTIERPVFMGNLPPQIVQPTQVGGVDGEEGIVLDIVQIDHLNPPAVATFPLGVTLPEPQRWNDALRIALVATAVVVHRPCVVAEADDCPAADRTGLHRLHRPCSVVCARAGSTARW